MTFELFSCSFTTFSSQNVWSTSWIFVSCLWTYTKVPKMPSFVANKWQIWVLHNYWMAPILVVAWIDSARIQFL